MKDRRGRVGRITGIAEGVAAAARRRQRERAPRVILYDERGHPRLLPADVPPCEDLVATASRMSDLLEGRPESAPSPTAGQGSKASTGGVSVPETQMGTNEKERQRRNA